MKKTNTIKTILLIILLTVSALIKAETGYDLWLRYKLIDNTTLLNEYKNKNVAINFPAYSDRLIVAKDELINGLTNLLGSDIPESTIIKDNVIVVGTPQSSSAINKLDFIDQINTLDDEGYIIRSTKINNKNVIAITAKTDIGILYGIFHYLRLIQTQTNLNNLAIKDEPKLQYRVLNHWDNLDGTIERGYAGYSIWDWDRLPRHKDDRYIDYARANASIGINGAVLNNVNANSKSLRTEWLVRASGLADAFRPYGIKIYLTARFSAPKEIGKLETADPNDPNVQQWWKDKVKEIYSIIPDFGGFIVKANSEGQPGPQDYGRSHADGANMIAEALEPYGGVLFWRAFVYENERNIDRVVTGYNQFKPLDGRFNKNVFVQPKNGPIDFQPREPFNPLFGRMPNTALSLEFQITQENLGHSGHLVYLGSLFEETLQSETYAKGEGWTVSKVLQDYKKTVGISGIAGVPNIGSDINWTGHLFGQANWHAFGRLAWDPDQTSKSLSDEWIRMTFSNDEVIIDAIQSIMLLSREAVVNYEMPLGLTHIMNFNTHNGPEPWHHDPLWTAYDYHKVTKDSIGVDRTRMGSNAVDQYNEPLSSTLNNIETCPEEYLLWFHRLPWDYKLSSGKTLWNEIVEHYYRGVNEVEQMQTIWGKLEAKIDKKRYEHTKSLLQLQKDEAVWWRDACLLFFQEYSRQPIPSNYEQPKFSLDYYKKIPFPYDWNKTLYFSKE